MDGSSVMSSTIDLWHCADTRSFRVLWTLEELSLPYRLHLLPFPPRARVPQYLAVNPLGTIPVDINIFCRLFQHQCRRRAAFAGLDRSRRPKTLFLLFSGSTALADRDIDC
jgi:hypothetical protein